MRPAAILAAPVLAALLAVQPAAMSHATDLRGPLDGSAERFIDSIGVNVHLSYRDGPYGRFDVVAARVRELGVRHLRDGVAMGQTDLCEKARALDRQGTRITYITQPTLDAEALRDWASCVGPALEAYEGANEYDASHPGGESDWADVLRRSQQTVYRAVKSSPALGGVRVIGPSLTSDDAARAVGNLSGAMDDGNMHDYTAGHEPETPGWGAGGYGSLPYNIARARMVCGGRPVISTENGYGTDGSGESVDDRTQAVYVVRSLLDHFAAGVPRTFDYELADEGGPPYAHYGLLHGDLTPKPAFIALASLIAQLHGPDPVRRRSAPPAVRASLSGPASLRQVALRRRDGRTEIAFWLAAPSYDLLTHRPLDPPHARVALTTSAGGATLYRYDDGWHLRGERLAPSGLREIPADDRVAVVELTERSR